jgi:hypothetical protein
MTVFVDKVDGGWMLDDKSRVKSQSSDRIGSTIDRKFPTVMKNRSENRFYFVRISKKFTVCTDLPFDHDLISHLSYLHSIRILRFEASVRHYQYES